MAAGSRDRPSLVYIAGMGHSGSTLLDMLLGGHTQMFSLGEAHYFDILLSSEERRKRNEDRCACSRPLPECPFWSRVLAELTEERHCLAEELPRWSPTDLRPLARRRRRWALANVLAVGLSGTLLRYALKVAAPALPVVAGNSHHLFDVVRRVSGRPVVIDSSKHALRMRLLYMERPTDTRVIFLTRDGRGFVCSAVRRTGCSVAAASTEWARGSSLALRMLANVRRSHYRHVTYESLCREPARTLQEVCEFLSLEFEGGLVPYRAGDRHNIAGNKRTRFDGRREVAEDDRWRAELSKTDLETFERIGGRLNRRLMGRFFRQPTEGPS